MAWRHRNAPIRTHGADLNTEPIIRALQKVGATVVVLTRVGGGCPDLLVGFRRRAFLLEVKRQAVPGKVAPSAVKVRKSQVKFAARWRGPPVAVVRTPEDALQAIGVVRRAA
jgi:hypothetical protein